MPIQIPATAVNALRRSAGTFGDNLGEDLAGQVLDELLGGIRSILNPQQEAREGLDETVTVGDSPATVNGRISGLLKRFDDPVALSDTMNLDFKIKTMTEVAQGANHLLAQNFDQDELDEFPALALHRVYDRNVPRGLKRGPKGTLIPVPEDNWPSRWAAAGEECGDDGWLPWEGDAQGGRGVALKSSGIWQALGDGAGDYDDTLGNAYPPFAFNSGFDVDGVPRKEAESLGLIDVGAKAKPAKVDFANLFAFKS